MTVVISTQQASDILSPGIKVADLIRRFNTIMLDVKGVRWSDQEAIDWINDGAKEIVLRRPGARIATESLSLAEGTRQNASDGTIQVIDIVRNLKSNGKVGSAVTFVTRHAMDNADPNWHARRNGPTKHYMIDERNPVVFWVYPPAVNGAVVEAMLAKAPPEVTQDSDILDMRPEFISAILNWMMYRAHSKDSEYAQGQIATLHYQAFADAIGVSVQAEQVNSATGNAK